MVAQFPLIQARRAGVETSRFIGRKTRYRGGEATSPPQRSALLDTASPTTTSRDSRLFGVISLRIEIGGWGATWIGSV